MPVVLLHILNSFTVYSLCDKIISKRERKIMNSNTEKLRKKYVENPPDGMTPNDIKNMSENDLLDMDYFLNEDIFDEDLPGEDGFYIF